jgi:glyoxylase-like metal-dependent hydrolase (beta-lactamase superfamily II)
MEQLAPGLRLLPSRPADAFNCYLVDDVLVDAATRWAWRRIERSLRGHAVRAHAITHAHADHQGSSAHVCDTLGVHPPPDRFTVDPARNRASMLRLAELRPSLTCFGHGPPLRDPGLLAHAAAPPG